MRARCDEVVGHTREAETTRSVEAAATSAEDERGDKHQGDGGGNVIILEKQRTRAGREHRAGGSLKTPHARRRTVLVQACHSIDRA